MLPFLQTNITSQMRPRGGTGFAEMTTGSVATQADLYQASCMHYPPT